MTEYRDGETRFARILESMAAAFVSIDTDWRIRFVNAEAERTLRRSRHELLGGVFWDLFPTAAGAATEAPYLTAVESGEPQVVEAYLPPPVSAWLEVRAVPSDEGLSLYLRDITAQREARELVRLSDELTERLASSLEIADAVEELARLVVPRLGDWSIVSIVSSEGQLRDVASWHCDPSRRWAVTQLAGTRFQDRETFGPVGEAIETKRPVVYSSGVTERMLHVIRVPASIHAIEVLAPESSAAIPLTANGEVRGVLSICRGANRPPLSEDELAVAISIAHRAGMALDNARLYAEQRSSAKRLSQANARLRQLAQHDRRVARALQDAMLTRLPEPDHLHLVARYLTATDGEQVGGDWYDALLLKGATILMIGDVIGHDISAAAVMGQLRNMLRALTWDRNEPPSHTVARLDRAVRELRLDTLATLVLARIEQGPEDRATGMRTLRWTNAGHPPPLLVAEDGTVTVLERTPDLMLGVGRDLPRHDHTHSIAPGSTLLLYTDGLVEGRDHDIAEGIERLADACTRHVHLGAEEMLDAMLADLVGAQTDDDVAVLAVRFNDQNQPRPPEAGPAHL